jgi:26S proteasome regulatory subunit T5
MSSAQPPNPPADNDNGKKPESSLPPASTPAAGDAAMDTTADVPPPEETWDDIPEEILSLSTDEILTRIRLIDNDIKVRRK